MVENLPGTMFSFPCSGLIVRFTNSKFGLTCLLQAIDWISDQVDPRQYGSSFEVFRKGLSRMGILSKRNRLRQTTQSARYHLEC